MKIGILTHFYKSTNYGGVLQAYALCKYLNDSGHSAKQILYEHSVTRISASRMSGKEFFKKIRYLLEKKVYRKKNQEIKKQMESSFFEFRESVPHTERVYSQNTISDAVRDFDAFITGSDQVWNPIWYDPAYMLHFVREGIPKIAYAASIGLNALDKEQESLFKLNLHGYTRISVREQTAANILSSILGEKVQVCVDPTLLLSADEWDEVASRRLVDEKYVFLYLLGDDIKVRKLAERFAQSKGIKLVTIPDLLGHYRNNDRRINAEHIVTATPGDFVSLIKHAEYVFTDSFHACVFSLLYNTKFFVFQRGNAAKMESRIRDLLDLFECPERFFESRAIKGIASLLSDTSHNYTREYKLFDKEKIKSIEYLKKALE